jgi:hypothetical protein
MWLIKNETSDKIIGTNLCDNKPGILQLWATRPTGKTFKIAESTIHQDVADLKNAIDYAIRNGDNYFEM